jgi:hypothetical protein
MSSSRYTAKILRRPKMNKREMKEATDDIPGAWTAEDLKEAKL